LTFVHIGHDSNTFLLPYHLRCASHTLSLLATTDFNNILKTSTANRYHHLAIAKCSSLWNMSRKPKSSEIISNILNCSLLFPIITRWNSLFDSVSQLLKYRDKLNTLTKELDLKFHFKEVDIDYLSEYVQLMKPIAIALDHLQGETNVYYGNLIPTLFSLRIRIQLLKEIPKEHNFRYAANLIDPLLKSLEKRFKLFYDLSPEVNEAILASCFHPAFKLRWIPENNDVDKKRIQNLCINTVEKFVMETTVIDTSAEADEDDFFVFSSQEQTKADSKANLEVIQFFNDKNKSLSILNNYVTIKKLFVKFNTNLCSSAPVERLFSFAGFIHCPTRRNLSDHNFEKLVFLKGNKSYSL